jgi:multiple antibiotic resistance protein
MVLLVGAQEVCILIFGHSRRQARASYPRCVTAYPDGSRLSVFSFPAAWAQPFTRSIFRISVFKTLVRNFGSLLFTRWCKAFLANLMSPLLVKISKDFATIWTTVDPISNVALFAGLTAALTRTERRSVALRASLYAAVILVVAVVAGQIILDAIGIHLHSLKVAGGIILFLFGLQMLFGRAGANAGSPEAGRDLAVFPLAVPSIAGPGAMMAVILLTDNDVYTIPQQAETGVVLLVVLVLNYLLLLASDFILRIIGREGASILVRVMGIILASLAVEIVLTALSVAGWGPPVRP